MIDKVSCLSAQERDRFIEDGYAVVALAESTPDGKFTYFLEKGSKWSRTLGSK